MLTCRQATQLISEKSDRRLSLRERVQLALHLAVCSACRAFQEQLQALAAWCDAAGQKNDPILSADAKLSDEARARLRAVIENAPEPPPKDET